MAIEIVSFPINSMVIFHSYVSLPEGRTYWFTIGLGLAYLGLAHFRTNQKNDGGIFGITEFSVDDIGQY